MRTRATIRRVAALVLSASFVLMLAAPASATIYSNGDYSDTYGFSYSCGSDVIEVSGAVSGHEIIRAGTGAQAGAFFDHNQVRANETHTNLATGKAIHVSSHYLFHETHAVSLGGTLFMFSSVLAGQPFTVRDSAGNVLLRDSGNIKEAVVFDTEGDDVPGGIFIESVSLSIAGPHPGLTTDLCDFLS
jgi:hypothetical protein